MSPRRCRLACCTLTLALAWPPATAQGHESPMKAAEELIERERLRSAAERAFDILFEPTDNGFLKVQSFVDAALGLADLGQGVAPYLINELEQNVPTTFFFCAYALGLLGTPDAERALRRPIFGEYPFRFLRTLTFPRLVVAYTPTICSDPPSSLSGICNTIM